MLKEDFHVIQKEDQAVQTAVLVRLKSHHSSRDNISFLIINEDTLLRSAAGVPQSLNVNGRMGFLKAKFK